MLQSIRYIYPHYFITERCQHLQHAARVSLFVIVKYQTCDVLGVKVDVHLLVLQNITFFVCHCHACMHYAGRKTFEAGEE